MSSDGTKTGRDIQDDTAAAADGRRELPAAVVAYAVPRRDESVRRAAGQKFPLYVRRRTRAVETKFVAIVRRWAVRF